MKRKLHLETLPSKTAKLIKALQQIQPPFLKDFYLSGGTALSLQLGHRQSIDLDFFDQESFDPKLLQIQLERLGQLKSLKLGKNTLNTFLKDVQVQFLGYPYRLLKPLIDWKGLKISSIIDIACTKLQTISLRGSKKDFVDLYFILKKYSLPKLFKKLDEKYQGSDFNKVHILKSLVYFDDAETQPMPKMCREITWREVKKTISNQVACFKL